MRARTSAMSVTVAVGPSSARAAAATPPVSRPPVSTRNAPTAPLGAALGGIGAAAAEHETGHLHDGLHERPGDGSGFRH